MAIYTELPIYTLGCDLISLSLDVHMQMKRELRRSLSDEITKLCTAMIVDIAAANTMRGEKRIERIDLMQERLIIVRVLLRVGYLKKVIPQTLWARSVEVLDAVGAQAGGWRNHTGATLSAAPAA
ncbi:four helix bundle protein [Polaromonas sp.]|uniref:four helix bundle protein n=1 Tax=Polaromonas sp. TaxID=1869339 RepID=UPI003567B226